jgi:hypothetical protein
VVGAAGALVWAAGLPDQAERTMPIITIRGKTILIFITIE